MINPHLTPINKQSAVFLNCNNGFKHFITEKNFANRKMQLKKTQKGMVTETLKKYTGTLWRHSRIYLRHPTNSLWSHPEKKGPHFKGSLIEDTYQGAMISVITANIAATFLSPRSAPEKLSSEAHPDRQQQMGCVKLCVVWCVTMCHYCKAENQQGRSSCDKIF